MDVTEQDLFERDCRPFVETSHRREIQKLLAGSGFDAFPRLRFSFSESARAVHVVTGVDIAKFDERKHHRTMTKAYYPYTGQLHMLNQSAAVAIKLLDQGEFVIMLTEEKKRDELIELISLHPNSDRAIIQSPVLHERSLLQVIYESVAIVTGTAEISGVNFLVYDSFMPSLHPDRRERPFAPIYEERIEDMQRLVSRRIAFLHQLALMVYDLILTYSQPEVRMVMISSLASRRPGGNLYVDTLHKVVSTAFLETLAKEIKVQELPGRFIAVELAPGVVDRGPYDKLSTRQATIERAKANGFPYSEYHSANIFNFPQLNPYALGELGALYLTQREGTDPTPLCSEYTRSLLVAGRGIDDVRSLVDGCVKFCRDQATGAEYLDIDRDRIPAYILNSNQIGHLPKIGEGFVLIPVCPLGQNF